MVITGLTRNQLGSNPPRVRIPPSPPQSNRNFINVAVVLFLCYYQFGDCMKNTDYDELYSKVYKEIGDLTPLKVDCGVLCSGACCKGDSNTGMILFPFEKTELEIKITQNGERLAICNGTCDRNKRPLACRIFPFFPTVDERGKVYVELDYRAFCVCPMVEHYDEILFDKRFLNAVKKVGKILVKDKIFKEFLKTTTEEIDLYHSFYDK